jgi:hypothetical protein
MALGAGSLLAVVAGSAFCPLTLSRRLLRFAAPALPAAAAAVVSGFSRTDVVKKCHDLGVAASLR